jgi:hypothetical protein
VVVEAEVEEEWVAASTIMAEAKQGATKIIETTIRGERLPQRRKTLPPLVLISFVLGKNVRNAKN